MTARQLKRWLQKEDRGWSATGPKVTGESVGHNSGRRIVEILGKKKADYDDDDLRHMAKVVGYVHRHLAQRPEGEIGRHPGDTRS